MSKSLASLFGTNRDDEENGKWFDTFGGDIQLKLRRYKAKKSLAVRNQLEEPLKKKYKNGKYPDEVQEDLILEHFVKGILLDWKGVYLEDGQPEVPFSIDAAMDLFRKFPDFYLEALNESIQLDNFRVDKKDTLKGN